MTTLALIAGAVVAAIGAIFAAFLKGTGVGADRARAKQMKAEADAQVKYDHIDGESPDLDGSIDRLRERSRSDDRA